MKLTKFGLALVAGVSAVALTAVAQDKFPSKTVEVITHAGAGGGTDVNSRMMMLRARRVLKSYMVVVNKRGGNGAAAMNYFKGRPADGHTIMTFTIGHAITMAKGKTNMQSIDDRLRALIELRVSQINGCAYCVDLHTTEARKAGETTQRLDCLTVWREVSFFDKAEKAALAWAEAVTTVAETGAPTALYEALCASFSEQQVVDLTLIIAQMNAWNRLAISFAHLPDPRGD